MSALRLMAFAVACCCLPCSAIAATPLPAAWGYVAWWMPHGWRSLPLAEFERLLFFQLSVNAKGEIDERNGWPENWSALRAATQIAGTPLDLTLGCFDAENFNALFASPEATERLLNQAIELAGDAAVSGLQLDFEIYSNAKPESIKAYRRFAGELANRLRRLEPARQLSVFLPMGADAALYDAPTLAQIDRVVFQGYDAHWLESKAAGPVAPLAGNESVTWEKAVALGLELGVPRQRMLMAFPLYGIEWPVQSHALRAPTTGRGVHTFFSPAPAAGLVEDRISVRDRVRAFGATHDSASGSAYYQFTDKDGRLVEGWFEDWWSLARKTDYLYAERLGGIAFFSLGYDQGELTDFFFRQRGALARHGHAIRDHLAEPAQQQ